MPKAVLPNQYPISEALNPLLQELAALYENRRRKAEKKEVIDFDLDGGGDFYSKVAGAIFDKIKSAKFKFLVSDNKEVFVANFHKFFIDRCRGNKVSSAGFNRSNFENSVKGADLCYREGFALAFLIMLEVVSQKIADKKTDISSGEFIELLEIFNYVSRADFSGKRQAPVEVSCGHSSSPKQAQSDFEKFIKFGKISSSFSFQKLDAINNFPRDFNHLDCAEEIFQDFLKKDKTTISHSLLELVDHLGSCCHLFPDANGRSAILMGWFLAIANETFLPISIYAFWNNAAVIDEGVKWTSEFLSNPKISTTGDEVEKLVQDQKELIKKDFFLEKMAIYFVAKILSQNGKHNVYVKMPIPHNNIIFFSEETSPKNGVYFDISSEGLYGAKTLDLTGLKDIIRANQSSLKELGEKDGCKKIYELFVQEMTTKTTANPSKKALNELVQKSHYARKSPDQSPLKTQSVSSLEEASHTRSA